MRLRLVATIALIAVALAGCTSGSSPDSSPSPTGGTSVTTPVSTPPITPSSTPPTSPTVPTTGPNVRPGEKPPVLTKSARKKTPSAALFAAEYWFRALDWGYATTSSTLANELYAPSCHECQRFSSIFDEALRSDNHFRGGRIVIYNSSISNDKSIKNTTPVDVTFTQGGVRELANDGTTVTTAPRHAHVVYRVYERWSGNEWSVIDLNQVVIK